LDPKQRRHLKKITSHLPWNINKKIKL
jgi:hypothetical protein